MQHSKMNNRKNNDESVIFPKINRGSRPYFHETSFHVSSSARQEDSTRTGQLFSVSPLQGSGRVQGSGREIDTYSGASANPDFTDKISPTKVDVFELFERVPLLG
jgi:hypothetical protein